jgi:signal transduction histidine kinase
MSPTRWVRGAVENLPHYRGVFPKFWFSPRSALLLSIVIIFGFFVADVLLPRGATVAIGYCLVPAVMAGRCSRRVLFLMVSFCTVATWMALFTEPGGSDVWISVFDRLLVTGVLWFSLFLVLRRISAMDQLALHDQALNETALELERSNNELSSFTSVVAHDLRGPLNTIGLLTQLLSISPQLQADTDCAESVESIQNQVARLDAFVESLLIYGRVGFGDLNTRNCDCNALVDDVRLRLKADLQKNNAEISHDPLPVIHADPTLLAQLFQNLIENAVKYCGPAAPHIHVSADQQPQGWQFTVQDNGMGIRPEDLQRIFEPFQQADAAKSRNNGVGLGLATCRRIVERHGGQILAQSSPGDGTAILFTIPFAPDTQRPAPDHPQPDTPTPTLPPSASTSHMAMVGFRGLTSL